MRRIVTLAVVAAAIWALYATRDRTLPLASEKLPFLHHLMASASTPNPERERPGSGARNTPAVPVVLTTAERKAVPIAIEAVGTVQSVASIALKPRIDSQITAIRVTEGALVKEGDLLVSLDDRALKAQLAQAEAMVAKDKAQLEQSRRDLARAEELLAKKIGTEVQRDTAATALKVQQAQLAADEANRANLATALSYTEIRAPISGRIGSIALKLGTTVRAADAQAIATINQVDPIYVSFAVPQSSFGELRAALAAGKVPVEARVGESTVKGTLAFVENTVDLATGTVLARAAMPNADEKLWPGAFVSVRAVLGTQADAIAVPSAAVQIGQKGPFVFVVRDGRTAEMVPVTVARALGGESVIADGLKGGERVVVDGQLRLVDGAQVQIEPGRASEGVARRGDDSGPQRRG